MIDSHAITLDEYKYKPALPIGALVLVGVSLIYAVGLLISARILHMPPARWQRPYGGLVQTLVSVFWVVSPGLLAGSIVSLIGERVRSRPWLFGVLLAAAVVLVLATAALVYVVFTPGPYQGAGARWDCGSSGQAC